MYVALASSAPVVAVLMEQSKSLGQDCSIDEDKTVFVRLARRAPLFKCQLASDCLVPRKCFQAGKKERQKKKKKKKERKPIRETFREMHAEMAASKHFQPRNEHWWTLETWKLESVRRPRDYILTFQCSAMPTSGTLRMHECV